MWSCLNAVTLVTILPGIEQLLPNLQLYTLRQQTDEKLRERNRKLKGNILSSGYCICEPKQVFFFIFSWQTDMKTSRQFLPFLTFY